MKIIVDSNILISTLMSADGIVGTFLLRDLQKFEKLSCYMLFVELFDKKEKILKYTKTGEKELLELLFLVLKHIEFINENQISKESWNQALELTKEVDIKDVSFVALTIETKGILLTGDRKLIKGLKKAGFTRVTDLSNLRKMVNQE